MGLDAMTPPGLWERIRQMIRDEVGVLLRSGLLRNASISEGGLTIKGGFLRLLATIAGGSVELFYVGPVSPDKADGSPQQGWRVRRADGTVVLELFDAFPTDAGGALNQALNWRDRSQHVTFADDTNSGQGMARPWLSGGFARTRYTDFSISTTSSTFETLWDTYITHQQPRLTVMYRASMDTSGATGETRLLLNGNPIGAVGSESFSVVTRTVGPVVAPGDHMEVVHLEIQARCTSASGAVRVEPILWRGEQSA